MTARLNPLKPNAKLAAMWRKMTPPERLRFATLVKSTPGSLRQSIEGRRKISPDLAVRIERATVAIGVTPINRTSLNETCKRCDYAKACLKAKLW